MFKAFVTIHGDFDKELYEILKEEYRSPEILLIEDYGSQEPVYLEVLLLDPRFLDIVSNTDAAIKEYGIKVEV